MLIIIEGLDGTGKSTIARRLHDAWGFEVLHKGPPSLQAYWEYTHQLLSYQAGSGRHVVCDRWHLGELVYPHTRRGGRTDMLDGDFEMIDGFLKAKGATLVYCWGSINVIEGVLHKRGESINVNQMITECELFDRAVLRSSLPYFRSCLDDTMHRDVDVNALVDLATVMEARALQYQ